MTPSVTRTAAKAATRVGARSTVQSASRPVTPSVTRTAAESTAQSATRPAAPSATQTAAESTANAAAQDRARSTAQSANPQAAASAIAVALVFALLFVTTGCAAPAGGEGERAVGQFDDVRNYTGALPAFPGAVGFGSTTRGGRGGAVLRVTTLDGEGPGSLRWALSDQTGPRTVVFEVGGTIDLDRVIVVEAPFVTVAGETAPEPGITLIGAGLIVTTHDVVIRHLRIRPGDRMEGPEPGGRDGLSVSGRPGGTRAVYNVVVDRCSISWATDEGVGTWFPGVYDVTFSNCIIAENLSRSIHPEGEHSKGLLLGDHARRVAIVDNLFAHNRRRNPLLKGDTSSLIAGNVIYNPGAQAIGFSDPERSGPARATIVGNVLIPGPDTRPRVRLVRWAGIPNRAAQVYLDGNTVLSSLADEPRPFSPPLGITTIRVADPPVSLTPLRPDRVGWSVEGVLANAGARPWGRDTVDERIVASVRRGDGAIIDSTAEVGGLPSVAAEPQIRRLTLPETPNQDTDGDGYTDLENWIHGFSDSNGAGGTDGAEVPILERR